MHALYRAVQVATLLSILGAAFGFQFGAIELTTAKAIMLVATLIWFAAPLLTLAGGGSHDDGPLEDAQRTPVA